MGSLKNTSSHFICKWICLNEIGYVIHGSNNLKDVECGNSKLNVVPLNP